MNPESPRLSFPVRRREFYFPPIRGSPGRLRPPGTSTSRPAIGLAYSPEAREGTFLGKILGGPGKTSIRAGFGIYYTSIEALTIGILAGNAPFGTTYSSPAPPLFATPFVTASTGQDQGQPFPVALATGNASRSNPNPNIDWSQYEPISGIPAYAATNRIPYVDEYMLSVQRQLGTNTVLSASYVGTQGHRLLVMVEANPGDAGALPEPEPAQPGGSRLGHMRPLWRKQRIHDDIGAGD